MHECASGGRHATHLPSALQVCCTGEPTSGFLGQRRSTIELCQTKPQDPWMCM